MADRSAVADSFRTFARTQCHGHSPLYERLSLAIAEDEELLALLDAVPPSQRRPTLLLAAVHELVLAGADHELGRSYPSVTADPEPMDPWPRFRSFCHAFSAAIVERLATASTQTNDVRRSAALTLGLAWAARSSAPIALVELGASAGLLLRYDRYRLEVGGHALGPAGSTVTIEVDADEDIVNALPTAPPATALRIGLDLDPIDCTDAVACRWLEALTWPDCPADLARLRAALAIARSDPPQVERGDAVRDLRALLDAVPDDVTPVVFHTTLFTYLDRSQRGALVDALDEVGSRRPLCWLPVEAPGFLGVDGDNSSFALCGQRWQAGVGVVERVDLARVDAYGRTMRAPT